MKKLLSKNMNRFMPTINYSHKPEDIKISLFGLYMMSSNMPMQAAFRRKALGTGIANERLFTSVRSQMIHIVFRLKKSFVASHTPEGHCADIMDSEQVLFQLSHLLKRHRTLVTLVRPFARMDKPAVV